MSLSGNDACPQKFKSKKKRFTISTKNMGVNIDKNEYYEIKLSNSAHPEWGLR